MQTENSGLPQPISGILDIAAYVPGSSGQAKNGKIHKMSSNETPLGPSPRAIDAYSNCSTNLETYPDGSANALRSAIANKYALNPNNIVMGNGSDEILSLLAQAYLGQGDEAIFTEFGFLVYKIVTLTNGATPVVAPEKDHKLDVDLILERISHKTKIIFIANPNNPTGTYIPFDEVRRLQANIPSHVLLVLDAAYAEYVKTNDYESGIELVSQNQNVVMTRTFSKVYGLAALRIGWAYCPNHVADVINRIRGPFNISAPAIAAASEAISDDQFLQQAVEYNAKWLQWVYDQLTDIGYKVTPSVGNFLLIHFDPAQGFDAEKANQLLSDNGVFVRSVAAYGLPNALRASIGTEEGNRLLVDLLGQYAKSVS